jgi:hypothetical protein
MLTEHRYISVIQYVGLKSYVIQWSNGVKSKANISPNYYEDGRPLNQKTSEHEWIWGLEIVIYILRFKDQKVLYKATSHSS